MFCPRCGKEMDLVDGTYRCSSGDMPLSKDLHDGLSEVYVHRTRSARLTKLRWAGAWYCPGCGRPTSIDAGHVRCAECGECLDEFLRDLIELHPHRPVDRPLVPFWVVSDLPHAPLGFGVTAFDLDEVFSIIVKGGYEPYLPSDRARVKVTANAKFDDLPAYVREHCGPIVVRGLWYPWPTPGWFSKQQ